MTKVIKKKSVSVCFCFFRNIVNSIESESPILTEAKVLTKGNLISLYGIYCHLVMFDSLYK